MLDLAKERREKHLSQQQLADKCGVIRQTISNIETGFNKPSVELAKKIANELELDWTLFFND